MLGSERWVVPRGHENVSGQSSLVTNPSGFQFGAPPLIDNAIS